MFFWTLDRPGCHHSQEKKKTHKWEQNIETRIHSARRWKENVGLKQSCPVHVEFHTWEFIDPSSETIYISPFVNAESIVNERNSMLTNLSRRIFVLARYGKADPLMNNEHYLCVIYIIKHIPLLSYRWRLARAFCLSIRSSQWSSLASAEVSTFFFFLCMLNSLRCESIHILSSPYTGMWNLHEYFHILY